MAPVCDSIPCDCLPHSEAQMCAMGSAMQPSVSQIIQHIHQRNEEEDERRERLAFFLLASLLILSASLSGKVQTMLDARQQACRPIRCGPGDPITLQANES